MHQVCVQYIIIYSACLQVLHFRVWIICHNPLYAPSNSKRCKMQLNNSSFCISCYTCKQKNLYYKKRK